MRKLSIISFIFSFILLAPFVLAYTTFNPTTNFSATNAGFSIWVNDTDGSLTFPIYSSCGGLSNCANLTDTSTNHRYYQIFVNNINGNVQNIYTNLTTLVNSGFSNHTLPKNAEGILSYSYQFDNSTPSSCSPYEGAPPAIYAQDQNGITVNYTALNTTAGVAHNATLYIAPYAANRTLYVFYYVCSNGTNTSIIKIGDTNFHTYYYTSGGISSFDSNLTVERLTYCGANSVAVTSEDCGSPIDNIAYDNGVNAWILAVGQDGYMCHVFKTGSIVYVRSPTNYYGQMTSPWWPEGCASLGSAGIDNLYTLNEYSDLWSYISASNYTKLASSSHQNIANVALFTNFYTTTSNSVVLGNSTAITNNSNSSARTDGSPPTFYALSNLSFGGAFDQYNSSNWTVRNLITYANMTSPTGTKFLFSQTHTTYNALCGCTGNYKTLTDTTPAVSITSKTLGGCTPGFYCNAATNNQSYRNLDCSSSSETNCGSCGCSADGVIGYGCAWPALYGTYCAGTRDYITTRQDCTGNTTGQCPVGTRCGNFKATNPLSVYCFNDTSEDYEFCINSAGVQINCSAISGNTSISCTDTLTQCYDTNCNPIVCYSSDSDIALTTAEWLNFYLGNSNGSAMVAAMISIGVSFALFWKSKSKKIEAFIVPLFIMLGFFAMPGIAWFPSWIFFVMVVFSAVFIFFKVRG